MVRVSFKLGKTGTKYCPKSLRVIKSPCSATDHGDKNFVEAPDSPASKRKRTEVVLSKMSGDRIALSLSSTSSEGSPITSEHESSFAVNLLLDGFSIGRPTEKGKQPPSAQELTASVHPYDRTTESLFQAIDGGWLPGDIHEDMPCKYVDGCVICEVRDYRKGSPISGDSVSSGESFPVVQKVLMRPTMENIVKDIASMAEDSWTYSDLIEIESRILKAVRPKLCLDPTPMLERLCENPNLNKLNLGVPMTRRQRMQKGGLPQVRVSTNSHGKKVSIDKATENAKSLPGSNATNSIFEDSSVSLIKESSAPTIAGVSSNIPAVNSKSQSNIQSGQDLSRFGAQTHSLTTQTGLNRSRPLHGQGNQLPISPSSVSTMSFASGSFQDWSNTFIDARIAGGSMLGKRDNVSVLNKLEMKKQKQELACMDKFQQQNTVPKLDTTLTKDPQRKDKMVQQDQKNETVHFSDVAAQRHPQQLTGDDDQQVTVREVSPHESKLSPHFYQRSTWEFKVKEQIDLERGQIAIEETEEVERIKDHQHSMELDNEQPDQQHMLSQCFSQQHGKPSFQWHSVGQLGRKDKKKDDLLQKTKFVKSSRELQKLEVRGALQSIPLSNSGELSQPLTYTAMPTASLGPSYNNITVSAIVRQQREKQPGLGTVLTSVTGVHSSQLDSQKQWVQPSMSFGRHRSNSLPETPLSSGVASVESITDSMTPSNINSPSTGTAPKPSLVAKADQPVVALSQNKQVETISKLMSLFQNSMELDNDQQPEQPDQQTEQPDQQQIPSQHFSQQQDGKLSFQQRSVGHLGQKDRKRDDLFQKTKLLQSTREFQKPEVRGPLQSIPLSKSGELSQPLTSAAVLTSLGPSHNITVPVILGKQREKPLGLETVSTATGVNSSQLDSQSEQVQPSLSFGQHRSNSLPENPIASRVASAGSTTDSVIPLNINSPTGTTPMPSLVAKVDQPVAALSQNKHVETISKLVSMFQHSMELDNDQQLEQPDQQQMPSWCFSQQQDGKLSFQCHSIGQLGQKDKKRDDSLQKTKLVQISRQLQKLEVKGASQSSPLSKLGELSQPLTSAAVLTGCFGPSYNKIAAHVALGKQREEPLALATVSTKVTGVNSSQLDSWNEHVQSSMSFGRCRSNSFPEMLTASGSASPGSVTDSMIPLKIPSPSTGTASMCSFVGKTDQPVAALGQNKHLETISKLVSVLQRHGIHTRKRKVDELPEVKKQPHYWPLHLDALASDANNEDQEDAKGQRSVTDSMIPSKTNSSSTGIAPMHSLVAKTDRLALALREDTHFETISKLVTMFQRHGLHTKKRKTEEFPEVKKQPPHWPLQLIALPSDVNNEDRQDVEGQRSMASSLVLGGVKVCKSRIINFERTDFLPQGTPVTLHINRVRLVMCERAKDGMVEAVVQYLSSSTPHDDLLSLPNTHYADTLAMQFCALMVKDGYKLTEDQIQPVQSQPNFPPTPASAV